MANRRRLGVALVLDGQVAAEVDGLRRAVGDPALARIPPHITLVPPVNVHRDRLGDAVDTLRRAAGSVGGGLRLTLGPPETFLPVNPVLYLGVGGDLEGLATLRDRVFADPLARPLSWPWVPHVTLADSAAEARIRAAVEALSGYSAIVDLDRLVLLEESAGRVWHPLADAALGPVSRVGTGGLPLELVGGRLVDPRLDPDRSEPPGVVVNAYREGQPVGWARLVDPSAPAQVRLEVRADRHGEGIEEQLEAHMRWLAGLVLSRGGS